MKLTTSGTKGQLICKIERPIDLQNYMCYIIAFPYIKLISANRPNTELIAMFNPYIWVYLAFTHQWVCHLNRKSKSKSKHTLAVYPITILGVPSVALWIPPIP